MRKVLILAAAVVVTTVSAGFALADTSVLMADDWDDGLWDGTPAVPLVWKTIPAPVVLDTVNGKGRMACDKFRGTGRAVMVTNVSFNLGTDLPVRVKLDDIVHTSDTDNPRFRVYVSNMPTTSSLDTAPDLLPGVGGLLVRTRVEGGDKIFANTFQDTVFNGTNLIDVAWSNGWDLDFTINAFSGSNNVHFDAPVNQDVTVDFGALGVSATDDMRITFWMTIRDNTPAENENVQFDNFQVFKNTSTLIMADDWADGAWDGTPAIPLTWEIPASPVTLDTDAGNGRVTSDVLRDNGRALMVTNKSFNLAGSLPVRVKLSNITNSTDADNPRFRVYVSNMAVTDSLGTAPDLLSGVRGVLVRTRVDGTGRVYLNTFQDTVFNGTNLLDAPWSNGWNLDFTINSFAGANNVHFDAPVSQDVTVDFASLGLTSTEDYHITLWLYNYGTAPNSVAFDDFEVTATQCSDPFADLDGDEDVDMVDFAAFQLCYTGAGDPHDVFDAIQCGCLDQGDDNNDTIPDSDGDIDEFDFAAFDACASGADVPADTGCDG